MKKFWKNYKSTIILILGIVIGCICGLIFGEKANFVKPLGDLFLNLMFVIIVPMVFLTLSTTIAKISSPKRFGKVMASIIGVFIVTSLVAVIVGLGSTYFSNLVNPSDTNAIKELFDADEKSDTSLNVLESTVQLISVDDFSGLLSKNNVIAIVVFSILFGFAMRMGKEKSEPLLKVLESANTVIFNFIKIFMYYAPIGLGCYFASLVGTLGGSIAVGFLKTFIIYTIVALVFYFGVYSLYAFIAGGKEGFKRFWKNILPSTFTALGTCSSGASIPVNIDTAKRIGVSDDVAEMTIPLGTSLHKEGSVIGSVFKIMFLVCLFGTDVSNFGNILQIVFVSLVATLLITAVPIGGGTISEMMIISMMGYPVASLPVLTMVATIIDAPATMLNVVGDASSSMLVSRVVDGKDWIRKNEEKISLANTLEVGEEALEIKEDIPKKEVKNTTKNSTASKKKSKKN